MVFGRFVSGTGDLAQVKEIRQKVFIQELGIEESGEMPDEFCMYAVVYDGDCPAGTGCISYDGDRFTIAGIAVLQEYRGQKYGDFLIRLLIDKAIMSNAREIYLDALAGTEKFFEITGFEKCGERYENRGKVWIPMLLHTDRIHKCCGCGK